MKHSSNVTHVDRMMAALVMAAPFALGVRYEELAHCVEASVCGAAALKRHKIEARAIPCAFVCGAPSPDGAGYMVMTGHNAKSAYEWQLSHADGPAPAFDDWKEGKVFPDDPLHMVIEAKHCGKRSIIDLTAGQARETSGGLVKVPNVIVGHGEGWPCLDLGDGAWVEYGPSHRQGDPIWRDYENKGLVDDMVALMAFALECRLDPSVFMSRLSSSFVFDRAG